MRYTTRRLLLFIGSVELIVAAGDFCCGSSGVTTWIALEKRNKELEQEIIQQREYITRLQQLEQQYLHDPFAIERLARERLHMACKDEMIFLLP